MRRVIVYSTIIGVYLAEGNITYVIQVCCIYKKEALN